MTAPQASNFKISGELVLNGLILAGNAGGDSSQLSWNGDLLATTTYVANAISGISIPQAYIVSVSGNLSVDGSGNLTINEAGIATDLVNGSSYLTQPGAGSAQIDINLSALESQLVADGFYNSGDLPANYITSVNSGDNLSVSGGELSLNENGLANDLTLSSEYIQNIGEATLDVNVTALASGLSSYFDAAGTATSQGFITSSGQYIQSTTSDFTVSGSELELNYSNIETQLTSDGFAHTSDIPSLSGYVTETGEETLSNKTIQGPLYFNDNVTVSNEGEIVIDPGTNNFQVIALTNDLDLVSNDGNIILNADGNSYVGSAASGNEIATQGFVTGQGYITSSGQYIQSVSGDFTVSDGELQINPSTFVSDLASGSTYIEASGDTIDINLSSLETALANDGFAKISDVHAATAGLSVKDSVKVATNAAITLTSTFTSIDGVTLADLDRVLVKNQGTASENGIYTYSISTGLLVRAEDQESPKEGDFVYVEEGDYAKSGWIFQADNTVAQFSAAGEYTFNGGLHTSGSTVSVDYSAVETQLVSDGFAKTSDIQTYTAGNGIEITDNVISLNPDVEINAVSLTDSAEGIKASTVLFGNKVTSTYTRGTDQTIYTFDSGTVASDILVNIVDTQNNSRTSKITAVFNGGNAPIWTEYGIVNSTNNGDLTATISFSGNDLIINANGSGTYAVYGIATNMATA